MNTPPAYPSSVPPLPPKKKSALPWILGGCGCLFLLLLAAGGIGALVYYSQQSRTSSGRSTTFEAPADWNRYNSATDPVPDAMAEHFVHFFFRYPPKFQIVPSSGNFVKVEESSAPGTADTFTYENLGVGYFNIPADGVDAAVAPILFQQIGSQFAAGFPGYREVAQSEEQVAGYTGRTMIFEAELKGTPRGDVKIFGKVILVRKPGADKGVTIIMLATSEDPAIKTVYDVGVKGDLPGILQSFQLP